MSLTLQLTGTAIRVPDDVPDNLAEFREWAGNNDLPDKTRVDYYRGKVWVDMGREQVYTHGLLKTVIAAVLTRIAMQSDLGNYWCNGVLLSNEGAELSGNPDGTFVSHETIQTGRVTLTEGADDGFVELVGT